MKFNALLQTLKEIEQSPSQSIFESIGQGDQYFVTWEREIHPILCEVALSPDQINQLFKGIETGAGRTGLGKTVDAVKGAANKVSDVWFNKFGGMLQSSGPVQAFDQKWEDIKSKIAAKNPGLATKLAKYGEFAKNNPKLHKFLLAIAGSAAAALGVAVAGGVGAGALAVGTGVGVATGILNIADRLLQGQKASTAIGRGATTGAIAGLAAGAAAKIGEMIKAGINSEVIANLQGTHIQRSHMEYNGVNFFAVTKEPETSMLNNAWKGLGRPTPESIQRFAEILTKVGDPAYQQQISKTREIALAAAEAAKSTVAVVKDLTNIAASAAGGVSSAASNQRPTESLSESQIQELFGFTGNKIDASKLEKAWKKAGSPTDSDDIARILQDAGVDQTVINQVFADQGITITAPAPAPGPAPSPAPAPGPAPSPAPAPGPAPSPGPGPAPGPRSLTVGEIKKILPTLTLKNLKDLQKYIDSTLARKGITP